MGIFRGTGGTGDSTTDATITEVTQQATNAAQSASDAASSASSASSSASTATTKASEASASASSASSSASTATTKANEASGSALVAFNSASIASSHETNAETAKDAAVVAQGLAEDAQTSAETAQDLAETAQAAAETARDLASASASSASSSASTATTKAGEALASANSASDAQTAAESARDTAVAAQEAIDGLYLGTATSNPTVDLNGDPVTSGDWYFNTVDSSTRIYDGSAWNTINPDLLGDVTPQLGGNLDLNSNNITGTGDLNFTGSITLTGTVDGRDITTDGTKLDGIATSATANPNAIDNVVEDTTPQLGGNLDLNSNDITGTGNINVTGTVTADGLTVEADSAPTITIKSTDTSLADNQVIGRLDFFKSDASGSGSADVTSSIVVRSADGIGASSDLTISTDVGSGETTRALFGANGDISFYEDTGATAKFFWDASAESLAVGNSSVSAWGSDYRAIDLKDFASLATGNATFQMTANGYFDGTNWKYKTTDHAANYLQYQGNHRFRVTSSGTAGNNITWTDALTVTSAGNVGIGTSSPSFQYGSGLEIEKSGSFATLKLHNTAVTEGFYLIQDNSGTAYVWNYENDPLIFATNASEKMRIDSSGNLLVGTTNNGSTLIAATSGGGINIDPDGYTAWNRQAVSSNQAHIVFNQTGVDAKYFEFRKDGSTVGSIGTIASDLYIGSGDTSVWFYEAGSQILPYKPSTASAVNNVISIGHPSYNFKDLYLSNAVYIDTGNLASNPRVYFDNDNFTGLSFIEVDRGTNAMEFWNQGSERMRIDSSGNVGIGVAPSAWTQFDVLQMSNGANFASFTDGTGQLHLGYNNYWNGTSYKYVVSDEASRYIQKSGEHIWETAASGTAGNNITFSRGMTLDASGNLLIGTTDGSGFTTSSTNSGVKISDGIIAVNGAGGSTAAGYFNVFDDGTILDFRKDGTSVGSIGTRAGYLKIGSDDTGLLFNSGGDTIYPENPSTGALRDAAIDLGTGVSRFKDLYLSNDIFIEDFAIEPSGSTLQIFPIAGNTSHNVFFYCRLSDDTLKGGGFDAGGDGAWRPSVDDSQDLGTTSRRWDDVRATNGTIQTSDRNEKQDIEELSEAEQRVAVVAKGLLRKYRWINSVEEKGDDARIHFGIIAQDLEDAFTAEGLDAGRYGMFIYDEWWEAEVTIPAVEEQSDEDGNITVQAEPERTETEAYNVESDAPEGAIRKERRGIRYNQLLAFIIAAI